MSKKTTSKKAKIIGKRDYIDAETGEVKSMNVISYEDRDFNFHKIWLGHIISSLDLIGNQKIKVLTFVLDNLDYENKIITTYRQISRETGISLDTVRLTMKALIENDFLHMIHKCIYQVNPDMIFKGQNSHRMNILLEYKEIGSKKSKEEKMKEKNLKLIQQVG